MTPLAHYLLRQVLARPADREHMWRDPQNTEILRSALSNIHCFEITACRPLTLELCAMEDGKFDELCATSAFLPAPKTWTECRDGERSALLLTEMDKGQLGVALFVKEGWGPIGTLKALSGAGRGSPAFAASPIGKFFDVPPGTTVQECMLGNALMALALINSPKIVHQQCHEPHKGLVRELRQANAGIGQLLPWHEIKLEVTKPRDIDDGEAHANVLTGQRALHFVRKFMRVRLGKLEYVRSHWRGDPALGIHQGDYRVT
jgi:hypothetical protein